MEEVTVTYPGDWSLQLVRKWVGAHGGAAPGILTRLFPLDTHPRLLGAGWSFLLLPFWPAVSHREQSSPSSQQSPRHRKCMRSWPACSHPSDQGLQDQGIPGSATGGYTPSGLRVRGADCVFTCGPILSFNTITTTWHAYVVT